MLTGNFIDSFHLVSLSHFELPLVTWQFSDQELQFCLLDTFLYQIWLWDHLSQHFLFKTMKSSLKAMKQNTMQHSDPYSKTTFDKDSKSFSCFHGLGVVFSHLVFPPKHSKPCALSFTPSFPSLGWREELESQKVKIMSWDQNNLPETAMK